MMQMTQSQRWLVGGFASLNMVGALPPAVAQPAMPVGEWWACGADAANTKYSPLDQINSTNFPRLEIAWRWTSISSKVTRKHQHLRLNQFRATPLMADGLIHVSTALGQIAALRAGQGSWPGPTIRAPTSGWTVHRPLPGSTEASPTGRIHIATTLESSCQLAICDCSR